ncbi:hypothetical protein ACOMHN_003825 [Nucella lapillus]
MATLLAAGVLLALICLLSLVVNTFTLLLFFKRKRLRIRVHLFPLFHLAAVDLLALVMWSAVSVVITVVDWSPPAEACQAHAYFGSLWNMLHVHTLAVMAIERALRLLVKPSQHVTIFVLRVMLFLLIGILSLLKTYVIVTCVYVILWLPYEALTFVVNYDPFKDVPDWLVTVITCLTHCTQFAVPLVYLTYNESFRRCVLKTICGPRKK